MTDDKHRRQWLAMLAKLACPMDPTAATKALCDMLPMLGDFGEEVFTHSSLEYVASQAKRTPTYAELRAHLGTWWRDNRPAAERLASEWPALPGPAPQEKREPTAEEKTAVNVMVQSWKKEIAKKSGVFHLPEEQRPRALPLKDQALLAEYTAYANDERNPVELRRAAETRISMLLRKMGVEKRETVDA